MYLYMIVKAVYIEVISVIEYSLIFNVYRITLYEEQYKMNNYVVLDTN